MDFAKELGASRVVSASRSRARLATAGGRWTTAFWIAVVVVALTACDASDGGGEAGSRVEEAVRAAVSPLEERIAALEKERDRLTERVQALTDEQTRMSGVLDQAAASSARLEEEMAELYDDAIDQIVETRDSLGDQISRVVERLAREKMDAMVARDSGELDRMLASGGVDLDRDSGVIRTRGAICQTESLIEFLAVGEGGRDHESLLFVDCAPSLLNAALLSLGLEPGRPFRIVEKAEATEPGGLDYGNEEEPLVYYPPDGTRVYLYVEWEREGETVRYPAESLLLDRSTGQPMPADGWVFLGSRFALDEQTGEDVFVADVTRDLVSVWHSFRGNTILDNPHPGGRHDDTFVPNRDLLPDRGEEVTLLVSVERLPAIDVGAEEGGGDSAGVRDAGGEGETGG